jgi:hypothetical protein
MMVDLKRSLISDDGAFGILIVNNVPICLSLEKTFGIFNKVVIPPGNHPLKRGYYYSGGYPTFEVEVQGSGIEEGRTHTRVLLHAANYEDQLQGCIATGTKFMWMRGKRGVGSSKSAHGDFMKAMDGIDKATLRVMNPC